MIVEASVACPVDGLCAVVWLLQCAGFHLVYASSLDMWTVLPGLIPQIFQLLRIVMLHQSAGLITCNRTRLQVFGVVESLLFSIAIVKDMVGKCSEERKFQDTCGDQRYHQTH